MNALFATKSWTARCTALALMSWTVFSGTTAFAYDCGTDLVANHIKQLNKQDDNSRKTQAGGKDIAEPANIGLLKTVLRDYAYCGQYEADFKKVIDQADKYIASHSSVEHPAIVLDIDETSLSNWEEIEQNDFGFLPSGPCALKSGVACGDTDWEMSARASALAPTLALFKKARDAGIAVFFVTGRYDRPDLREATEKNLRRVGYDGWKDLIMRPNLSATAREFKIRARKAIQDQQFTIVANIGDQLSDLDENPGENQFHLPNPFYYLP